MRHACARADDRARKRPHRPRRGTHGCIVERDALVGINAVVRDEAEIGERAVVAACAFVRAGFKVPPQSWVAGVPAKVARALGEDEMAWKRAGTLAYQDLALRSPASLSAVEPLSEIEADRPRLATVDLEPLVAPRRV